MIILLILYIILIVLWAAYGLLIFFPEIPSKIQNAIKTIKGKTAYQKHTVGGNTIDSKRKAFIRENQNILIANRVPINKIRFVLTPSFAYDIDNNEINPVYQIMLPVDDKTGLFKKGEPIIEVGKPQNIIAINVGSYKLDDNYAYLKAILKRCKRGVAIFIIDEMVHEWGTDKPMPYKHRVDDETIRFAVLDDAIEFYNNQTNDTN